MRATRVLLILWVRTAPVDARLDEKGRLSFLSSVLCDGGEGLAGRGASRLAELGYTDISVLSGGTGAWKDAGFELFSGVNVPSKAFGEIVEHEYGTHSISADELKQKLDSGENMVVLDSLPFVEYTARNIPSGICVPGGELVYRVGELAPAPDTQVVVNCAGRTRSIIGAQSLINAGIPNPVVALRNGTMGWHLAGHDLETGSTRRAPELREVALESARAHADAVARRYGVARISVKEYERFRNEQDRRSLFVLDVRNPKEYEAGHLPGSRSAPGGQLVQETDQFVGTLRSRIVLVDDTAVRATMAASWLIQMGWPEVYVLEGALDGGSLEIGPEPVNVPGLEKVSVDAIDPETLNGLLATGSADVIDVSVSPSYRECHVPGAWFTIRARFPETLPKLGLGETIVVTSGDGVLARLAAPEAAACAGAEVKVLTGGVAAWRCADFLLETGETRMADAAEDIWLRPYEKDWGVEEAMQDYLTWEVALVEQIERDGTARFRRRAEFD